VTVIVPIQVLRAAAAALRSLVGQLSMLRGIRQEPKMATEIVAKPAPVPPTPTAG
jgi:hypothetical protein